MKGTLYSADFIKDSNGNLLLNEFNTDTDFTINALATFNYDPFIELLISESINEVHVIHKGFQDEFVNSVSQSLFNAGGYSGSFITTKEADSTIYPTDVDDAPDKFILRMAYNESAVFDSTYCKTNTNLFKLFSDNNNDSSIVNHYISSSEYEYVHDSLTHTFNDSLTPDVVWKAGGLNNDTTSLKLFKIGSSSLSEDERYSQFINEIYIDGDCITNYVDTSNGTSYMSAIRTCNIIYGTDLNNMIIGSYEVNAIFEKPTSISYDDSILVNQIDKKHYFEFTTNYFKYDWRTLGGIFQDTQIQKVDGTFVSASQVVPDERYVSLHISGSPTNDLIENVLDWSSAGSTFPEGSYVTSSVLISSASHHITYNIIPQLVLSGSEADFFLGPNMLTLVHDMENDELRYKRVYDINQNIDVMVSSNGNLIPIEEINMVALDGDYSTYEFDVEDDDTFIMNDVGVKIIGHNIRYAPVVTCFLAGTMISMADGTEKAIEEVIVGDKVLSYDLTTEAYVAKQVTEIDHRHTVGDHQSSCSKLGDTCGVYNIGGSKVHFTPEHPFLLTSGKWASLDQLTEQEPWKSEQSELITLGEGDTVLTKDGTYSINKIFFKEYPADTTVYNLTIEDTHTYIADGFVVHNK